MPTFQNKGKYLLVEITEPYSVKMITSAIHEVTAFCTAHNLNKALVDLRSILTRRILERHLLGIELAKAWGRRIQVAVILRPGSTYDRKHRRQSRRNILTTADMAQAHGMA
ncbi:MAG: hypothetical protein U0X92_17080 [Anaerolineales bacterium]